MKKFLIILLISIFMLACSSTKEIGGIEYDTYGLFNMDDKKNPDIQYEVVWENVIWGAILVETIVAPIYFFGFDMFEPVGLKSKIKGQVVK